MGAVLKASQVARRPRPTASKAAETIGAEQLRQRPGRRRSRAGSPASTTSAPASASKDFERRPDAVLPRRRRSTSPAGRTCIWALAQYQRFGLLNEAPDVPGARRRARSSRDLYAEVAEAEGIDVPDDDMAPFEVVLDGATFDPAEAARGGRTAHDRPSQPTIAADHGGRRRPAPTARPAPARRRSPPRPRRLRRRLGRGARLGARSASPCSSPSGQLVAVAVARRSRRPATTFTDAARPARATRSTTTAPTTRASGSSCGVSLQRVFTGFGLGRARRRPARPAHRRQQAGLAGAQPGVQLLRPVSPLAWFPIWLVVFQDAPQAAVFVIFITALWPTVHQHRGRRGVGARRPAQRRPGVPVRPARLPPPRPDPAHACRRSSPACGCRWASPGW